MVVNDITFSSGPECLVAAAISARVDIYQMAQPNNKDPNAMQDDHFDLKDSLSLKH